MLRHLQRVYLKSLKAKCSRNYISLWSKLGFWDPGEALFYQLPKICGIQSSARTTKARPKHPAERPKTVSPRHRTSSVIPKQGCGKNILRDWERLSMHIYGILGWSMLVWSHVSCIWLQCGIHTRRIPALCEIYCKSSATVPKRSFTFHSYKEVGVIEWKIDIFPDLKGSSTCDFWVFLFRGSRWLSIDSWMRLQNKLKHPHRLHLLVLFSGLSEILFCNFSPWESESYFSTLDALHQLACDSGECLGAWDDVVIDLTGKLKTELQNPWTLTD